MKTKRTLSLTLALATAVAAAKASAQVSKETLESIKTPDKVDTRIGTLEFDDGAPSEDAARKIYDANRLARPSSPCGSRSIAFMTLARIHFN